MYNFNTTDELARYLNANPRNVDFLSKVYVSNRNLGYLNFIIKNYKLDLVSLYKFAIDFSCKHGVPDLITYMRSVVDCKLPTTFIEEKLLILFKYDHNNFTEIANMLMGTGFNMSFFITKEAKQTMFLNVCMNADINKFDFLKDHNVLPSDNIAPCVKTYVNAYYNLDDSKRRLLIKLISETNIDIHYDNDYFFKFFCEKRDFEMLNLIFAKEAEQGPVYLDPDTFINACNTGTLDYVKFLVSLEPTHNKIDIHYNRLPDRKGYSDAFLQALRRTNYDISEYIISLASTHGSIKVHPDILKEYWINNNRRYWLIHMCKDLNLEHLSKSTLNSFVEEHMDVEYNADIIAKMYSNMDSKLDSKLDSNMGSNMDSNMGSKIGWKGSMCGLINFQNNLRNHLGTHY